MLTPLLPPRMLLPLLLLSLAMLAPEMTQGEEAVDPAKLAQLLKKAMQSC